MSGVLERTLALLERLAGDVAGAPLATLADDLGMPRTGCSPTSPRRATCARCASAATTC